MTDRFRFSRSIRSFAAVTVAFPLCAAGISPAAAQVFRCVSASGVPVYQGTSNGTDCRPVDLTPLTTIPAPARAAAARAPADAARRFPAVTPAAQRVRDDDRRHILEQELRTEQQRLDDLNHRRIASAPASGESPNGPAPQGSTPSDAAPATGEAAQLEQDIERSRHSIESLQRELQALGAAPVRD